MKRKILMILCLSLCLVFTILIVINILEKKEGTSFYNELPSHNEVDIISLKEDYPNIKAYIEVKGTNISYPIMQTNNNEYYLNHLPNDEKNKMGSIYLDYRNDNFKDDNTIIYGHNMNDGTMFSELENYKEQSYYEKHQTYTLYTQSDVLEIKIEAAYIADATKESLPINFSSIKEREKYLNKVIESNILENKVNLNNEDKLITLVTCADIYDTSRLVLIGKVLNEA